MNPARLLEHFDRISEAPDAVPRLRRFILDLAVRGKLVEQDPKDEPASELLKRIRSAKARLLRAGAIKAEKPLPPIDHADVPFDLPHNWAWIRVGDGFVYDAGAKRGPRDLVPERWLVELEDIEKDTATVVTRLTVADRESLSTKSEFQAGDILYGKLRPYLNKVVVAREPGYSTTEIVAIRSFVPLCADYLCLAFRRPDFVEYVNRLGRGTKMPRLRTPDALMALFPLPPLEEQRRIVAKVDELMALCDRLEAAQSERERRRDRLVEASLDRLNQPADDKSFRDGVRFHLGHLPCLMLRPDQIRVLRHTILNLAVRGKLVGQVPTDRPASEMLEQIAQDRLSATKAGHLRAISGIPKEVDARGFEIPDGWALSPLPTALYFQEGPGLRNWQFRTSGIPFLNIRTLQNGRVNRELCQFLDAQEVADNYQHFLVRAGDILCSTSGTIGKLAVATEGDLPLMLNTSIVRFCPYGENGPDRAFIRIFLASDLFLAQASKQLTGSAQVNMGPSHLKLMAIPLPPLAEQRRIIARVDELLGLCERLEAQLSVAQAEGRRLLEATLHEALAMGA